VELPIELLRLGDELFRFVDEPLRLGLTNLVFLDGFTRCLNSRHRELLLCDSDEPSVAWRKPYFPKSFKLPLS